MRIITRSPVPGKSHIRACSSYTISALRYARPVTRPRFQVGWHNQNLRFLQFNFMHLCRIQARQQRHLTVDAASSQESSRRGPLHALVAALQFILFYHIFSTYGYEISACEGPSMLPTLSVRGDWLLIDKTCRRGKGVSVGDVVDFAHPIIPGAAAVKRVIGLSGDFVQVSHRGGQWTEEGGSMMQVPEGHCWLLGDNLAESRDSRTYGPVPLALIKGKVIARIMPLGDSKWIQNNLDPLD